MSDTPPIARPSWRALPPGIWILGFVSLLMDVSSELVHSLLPVYLVGTLGASMVTLGLIEGVAEAAAALTKVFSGAWSDRLRRRKPLVVLGYALGAITKPVFPLAGSVAWVFGARFVDRIGKGLRDAPRDALVADLAPASLRGAAYGLRQALDSLGALLGPLLAIGLMLWFAGDVKAVLWAATVPAALCVLLTLSVREPGAATHSPQASSTLTAGALKQLGRPFWWVAALGTVFTLARFSEAFLVLRAQGLGLPIAQVPLVMVVMNLVYAALAYPAGAAADRLSPQRLLVAGLLTLVAADLVLAAATAAWHALAGAALWGLHMALTQGLFAKLVSDRAPAERRGTAFGIFSLVSGVALLGASALAGTLWQVVGPAATFTCGAALALLAALGVLANSLYRRATVLSPPA